MDTFKSTVANAKAAGSPQKCRRSSLFDAEVLKSGAYAEGNAIKHSTLVASVLPLIWRISCAMLAAVMLFILFDISLGSTRQPYSHHLIRSAGLTARSANSHVRAADVPLLEVFQVSPPVLTVDQSGVLVITDGSSNASVNIVRSNSPNCRETLVEYVFAFSYGQPFVGTYLPPACSFNRVTWNLTVTSAGRQFDRLGTISFGDIEVWRTSTAEPTKDGIIWTYLKDMTAYLSLLQHQQKLIFDLGNLVNDVYTGTFNVTLTASFFTSEDSINPADLILPVSGHNASQDQPSVFQVPPQTAVNSLTLPQNIQRAVFTVSATGQIGEEFWWSNVPSSDVDTFPQYGELYGFSPFREVQLFIDGSLAGVAWPFPVIFTGGVVPGLWRPIVGIDAFDLQEDEIDITPWLPLLCDGSAHNFQLVVSGLNNTGNGAATLSEVTGSYWLLTGKIFIWLDEEGHITTGDGPQSSLPDPQFYITSSIGKSANGSNETLDYTVTAQRSISIESTIHTSTGKQTSFWKQDLTYSNTGNFTDEGYITVNDQQTSGTALSSSGYSRRFSYPLYAYQSYVEEADNFTIYANINRGKHVQTVGQPVFPTGLESFAAVQGLHNDPKRWQGASLDTTQTGSATFIENTTTSAAYSFGQTEQDLTFKGISVDQASHNHGSSHQHGFPPVKGSQELFTRHVLAVNGSIQYDDETLANRPVNPGHARGHHPSGAGFTLSGVNGRGRRAHGHHLRNGVESGLRGEL